MTCMLCVLSFFLGRDYSRIVEIFDQFILYEVDRGDDEMGASKIHRRIELCLLDNSLNLIISVKSCRR